MDLKGRIIVYSIVGCPHCMKAKHSLKEKGIPFHDVSLDSFPQCRADLRERTKKTSVPQIFFNNIHVGGNDDLQKLLKDEVEFERLLAEVKDNAVPPEAPQLPDPDTAEDAGADDYFTCEKDEYASMIEDLKKSGLIKTHGFIFQTKNVFTGKEFVDWAVKTKDIDRARAVEMGGVLIEKHFAHGIELKKQIFLDDGTKYRLLEHDTSTALNSGTTSECQPRPAGELGENMRKLILKLYSLFLTPDGKKVDYSAMGKSEEFTNYERLSRELIRTDVTALNRQEKLAFFINVYNALVIHANIRRGSPTNLWQRYKFFNTVIYVIGGHPYSLQDIENGVLRANRKGVGMFSKPFGASDPRLSIALTEHEPLIHFALVCGAKSCPPIKTYSADGIMDQLRLAAEAFLDGDDGVKIDMKLKSVALSKIFSWYQVDFGSNNKELLSFIEKNMAEGEKKQNLQKLIEIGCKPSYLHYDWSLNS